MVTLSRPEGSPPEDFARTRRGVAGLFFAGYALAAFSAEAEPIHTDEEGLHTETVMLPTSDGRQMPAYLARPDAAGRFGSVIVVSEIFGVHEYIRDICRRLAKLGYAAIAPAFFFRAGDPAPLTDFKLIMPIVAAATNEQTLGDVGSTLAWLDRQAFVDRRRYAITGYCWGGAVVWMSIAKFRQLRAGVAWYGRLKAGAPQPGQPAPEERPWPIDVVGSLHAPVLGLYGGKDQGISLDDVESMRAGMRANGRKGEIVVYPDAGHGFHADYRPSYDKSAAEDGWARLLKRFKDSGVTPGAKS
jgi:carboxymethylenebutenolidase